MRYATRAALPALVLLLAAACTPKEAGAGPGGAQGPSALAALCGDPARPPGDSVKLSGRFLGFKVSECRFPGCARPTGLTRSDWLFQTGGDCFYVTGGLPPGVDAVDPSSHGRGIELTAEVRRDDAGKLYLGFVDGKVTGQ